MGKRHIHAPIQRKEMGINLKFSVIQNQTVKGVTNMKPVSARNSGQWNRILPVLISTTLFLLVTLACPFGNTTANNPTISAVALVAQAMQGAPLFANAAVTRSLHAATYGPVGTLTIHPIGYAYSTFKDFDTANPFNTSEQNVDGSNLWVTLYSTLYQVDWLTKDANDTGVELSFSSPTAVSPTVTLREGGGITFTYGGTWTGSGNDAGKDFSWAANLEENLTEALIADNMTESGQTSHSMKYMKHNATTGDLLIDLNYIVAYSDGSLYAPRVWVDGNTLDHSFVVCAAQYQSNTNGKYFKSLAGAGKNAGDGEYIIFHYDYQEMLSPATVWTQQTASGWYKVPAGAGVTEFEALPWYDTLDSLVTAETDPHGYGTQVEALVMFTTSALGSTLVDSPDDFANGNALVLP